jgi:hypothetical protein
MKKSLCLAASLFALNLTPVWGQALTPEQQVIQIEASRQISQSLPRPPGLTLPRFGTTRTETEAAVLTKFDLNFPGGTPKELVAAIEKAMNKPLNAIIPDEDANTKLPALKMNDVDVVRLFKALQYASARKVEVAGKESYLSASMFDMSYGFYTEGPDTTPRFSYPGTDKDQISDNSVWYFRAIKPTPAPVVSIPKICRFYPLTVFLDRGLTVDDITTAIQTGWRMAGDTATPELNYHKETKLLIAFGEPSKLSIIDDVLKALQPTEDPSAFFRQMLNQRQTGSSSEVQKAPAATNAPAENSAK